MTEFKPYLIIGTENYGIIGTDAEFTDSIGISLKVGDTVMLYDNGKKMGERPVCYSKKYGCFVMGVSSFNFTTGTCIEYGSLYQIKKQRDCSEVKHCEIVNCIRYIKEEIIE